jgi:L-ribulose-5-phosphate 4-epimerase
VSDATLGRALAETLAQHQALQIRAHGQVIVAESVKHLLIDSVHFVENAKALYTAHGLGEVEPLTQGELDDFGRTFNRDRHVAKLWKYYADRAIDSGLIPASWPHAA